jgi:hypothetical protein
MLTDKHYETIMDCLDEFDFDRVHKVMMHLNWTYSDDKDVPTVEYLRKNARTYLKNVATEVLMSTGSDTFIIGTGGFRYEAKLYENGDLWLRMAFEIESWDNCE